jgi:hypothetical protein
MDTKLEGKIGVDVASPKRFFGQSVTLPISGNWFLIFGI